MGRACCIWRAEYEGRQTDGARNEAVHQIRRLSSLAPLLQRAAYWQGIVRVPVCNVWRSWREIRSCRPAFQPLPPVVSSTNRHVTRLSRASCFPSALCHLHPYRQPGHAYLHPVVTACPPVAQRVCTAPLGLTLPRRVRSPLRRRPSALPTLCRSLAGSSSAESGGEAPFGPWAKFPLAARHPLFECLI